MALMALRQLQSNRSADTKLREQVRYAKTAPRPSASRAPCHLSMPHQLCLCVSLAELQSRHLHFARHQLYPALGFCKFDNTCNVLSDRLYPSRSSAYPSTLSAPAWTSPQRILGRFRCGVKALLAWPLIPALVEAVMHGARHTMQDGTGFVQVPSTWRPLIEDSSTLQLLLDFYRSSSPPLSSAALECLVRPRSGRRSHCC